MTESQPQIEMRPAAPSYEDAYRQLHAAYIVRLRDSLAAIDNILAQKQIAPLAKDTLERAMHLAHGLAGSGTTFGFPDITAAGRRVDQHLDKIVRDMKPDDIMDEESFAAFHRQMMDLRAACETASKLAATPAAKAAERAKDAPSVDAKAGFSVLVVDDDEHMLRLLSQRLQQRNIRVVPAPNGNAALAALSKHAPDLIILDIMMPGLSGHEVLQRLKQDSQYVSIPILMLTSQAQRQDVVSALHAGAIDYVVKPVDPDHLVSRVEKILDATRYDVLIADNDPLILQLLDSKFRNRGFRVRLVDDGKKAWEQIMTYLPDLVILDRMMPGLEGLGVLQNIRQEPSTKDIPVIVLSARKTERDIEDGMKRGAQLYVGKPFIPDDLIAQSLKILKERKKA
jgi:DNA-binding response OmpR family regulator